MERQSNFELLRIIAMLMIVGLHYFNGSMGGALSQLSPTDYNYYIAYFLESMFIVSVGCLVERLNQLDGAVYNEILVDKDTAMYLLNSDGIVVDGKTYKIVCKVTSTKGLIFFVHRKRTVLSN